MKISHVLPLIVLAAGAQVAIPAMGLDFRVDTEVFIGAEKEPVAMICDSPTRPCDRPAGLAALASRSLVMSVSLLPQAPSKNRTTSTRLRN